MTPINFDVKFDTTRCSSVNNSVAAAIHMMSPLSLRKSRSVRPKLKRKFERSIQHNEKFLKINFLTKKDSRVLPRRYAPNKLILKEMMGDGRGGAICLSDR